MLLRVLRLALTWCHIPADTCTRRAAHALPLTRASQLLVAAPLLQPGGSGFEYPTLDIREFQKIPLTVGAGLAGMFKKKHTLHVGGAPVLAERVPEGAKIK